MQTFGAKLKSIIKRRKKCFLLSLSVLIICFALSSVVEVLFNIKTLTLPVDSKYIPELSYTADVENEKTTIKVETNDSYIRKLLISYSASSDVEYQIHYTHSGAYDQELSESKNDIFEDSFSQTITNLETNVNDLTIEYATSDNIKIYTISVDNNFHFNIRRVFFFTALFLIMFFALYFYHRGFKTEKLHIYFATFALLLGTMFLTSEPIDSYHSWDGQIHFQRVVDFSSGDLNYSTGEFHYTDADIENSVGWHASEYIGSAEEQQILANFVDSPSTTDYHKTVGKFHSYSRLPYLPMALGYHLAKFIGLPFIVCFELGKITNLLCYVLLMTYAIRKASAGKRLLTLAALFPTNLFLSCQYSYDPIVFSGIAIFLVGLISLCVDKSTKINKQAVLTMTTAITIAGFAKVVYAPFVLLTFLIPKEKFRSRKQRRLILIGSVFLVLILFAFFILPGLSGEYNDPRGGDTSVIRQAASIIAHPLDYLLMLKDTVGASFFASFFSSGTILSFAYIGNIGGRSNFFFILLGLILFVAFTDTKSNNLPKRMRLGVLTATAFSILLIWNALYLSFTPVGTNAIYGVQGRYFLPLIFPLLLCLQPKNIQSKMPEKIYNTAVLGIPTILCAFSIYDLFLAPYSF